jgi:CBS domain-containing protein
MNPGKPKKKLLNLGGLFFLLEPILVREIMTPAPVTIAPTATAQEAAAVMVAERFGALPVQRKGETIGIVTETDLLRYFARTGGARPSDEERPKPPKQNRSK